MTQKLQLDEKWKSLKGVLDSWKKNSKKKEEVNDRRNGNGKIQ